LKSGSLRLLEHSWPVQACNGIAVPSPRYWLAISTDHTLSSAQQPNSGLGRLISEVSRSRIIRHTQPLEHFCTPDQLVRETPNYTTYDTHQQPKSMPSSGLEPAIPKIERNQTHNFDRMATQGPQYVTKSQNLSVSPCLREPIAILCLLYTANKHCSTRTANVVKRH